MTVSTDSTMAMSSAMSKSRPSRVSASKMMM